MAELEYGRGLIVDFTIWAWSTLSHDFNGFLANQANGRQLASQVKLFSFLVNVGKSTEIYLKLGAWPSFIKGVALMWKQPKNGRFLLYSFLFSSSVATRRPPF